MRRITQWKHAPSWSGRVTDPWRTRRSIPRYLRHSPLRTMRERLWFVSRLEPKVHATINLTTYERHQLTTAPSATVFLQRWLTTRAPTVAVRRDGGPSNPSLSGDTPIQFSSPPMTMRHQQLVTVLGPSVKTALVTVMQPSAFSSVETVNLMCMSPALAQRLARRAQRVNDQTLHTPTQVVKQHPTLTASAEASSLHEGTDRRQNRFPHLESSPGPLSIAAQSSIVNVDQLTDQVVRQLDRRLIASRERLGRI
jgi:hypothetical protein